MFHWLETVLCKCIPYSEGEGVFPFYVKHFEYPEKRYMNVTNYYYYLQPLGKDHLNQWSSYNLTLLQLEQTAG